MRLNKMTLILAGAAIALAPSDLTADDASDKIAHWCRNEGGSGDDDWTNSSNWSGGIIPGRYGEGGASGAVGWTAVFDRGNRWLARNTNGATKPYSISNVIFKAGTSVQNLGQGSYDELPLEPGGMLQLASDRTANLTVDSAIGLRDMDTAQPTIHIRNDSRSANLYLRNGFKTFTRASGNTAFCYPRVQFEGCGTIRLDKNFATPNNFRSDAVMAMDEGGLLRINGNVSNLRTLHVPRGSVKQRVEILSEKKLLSGSDPTAPQINAFSDIEIFGDGTLSFNSRGGVDCGFALHEGATIEVACVLEQRNTESDASFLITGSGTVRITGRNTIQQDIDIAKGTVEARTIGMAGEDGDIGLGRKIKIENGGTLRYTGSGETTDRAIELGYYTNVLEQAGSGPVTFTGCVTSLNWNAMIVLSNDTDFAATYAGPIVKGVNDPIVRKRGTGEWILSGANTTEGMYYLEGGTLTVASASSLPRLTVAGGGVLRVADGVTVSLNLTYASGSLDVRLGAGAKFIARNWSGQAPDWVRLNGHMARFRSDGELVPKLGCVVVFQ